MGKMRNPNGMGSYKLRKDGRVCWTQIIDGKPRVLYAKTPGELQNKVKKVSDLPIVASNKLTVDEWFVKWLAVYIKPLKKQATYNQYKTLYEQHVKPEIGHRKISKIISMDIQGVIAVMNDKLVKPAVLDDAKKVVTPEKRGYSTKTMKETKGVMLRAWKKLVKDKIVSENPVVDIEIPQKQAKQRKVLSILELHKLFVSMKDSRWIWSMRLLLVTGMRRGELLALRENDIDLDNPRIIIDESDSSTGIGDTKSAKIHNVPLTKQAMEYLSEQRKMLLRENNPILFNEELKKEGLLFPSDEGKLLTANSYTKMMRRYTEKIGLYASPHCLRHTFVFMSRKKLSLKDLQYALGHDESTTTLDIYGDMISDSSEDAANVLDSIFDKIDDKLHELEEDKKKATGNVLAFKRKSS